MCSRCETKIAVFHSARNRNPNMLWNDIVRIGAKEVVVGTVWDACMCGNFLAVKTVALCAKRQFVRKGAQNRCSSDLSIILNKFRRTWVNLYWSAQNRYVHIIAHTCGQVSVYNWRSFTIHEISYNSSIKLSPQSIKLTSASIPLPAFLQTLN